MGYTTAKYQRNMAEADVLRAGDSFTSFHVIVSLDIRVLNRTPQVGGTHRGVGVDPKHCLFILEIVFPVGSGYNSGSRYNRNCICVSSRNVLTTILVARTIETVLVVLAEMGLLALFNCAPSFIKQCS